MDSFKCGHSPCACRVQEIFSFCSDACRVASEHMGPGICGCDHGRCDPGYYRRGMLGLVLPPIRRLRFGLRSRSASASNNLLKSS
jgi:hypothetical protein